MMMNRMWHQISDSLLAYAAQPCFNQGNDLLELYNLFVKDLNAKMNPLKYSLITVAVAKQHESKEITILFSRHR